MRVTINKLKIIALIILSGCILLISSNNQIWVHIIGLGVLAFGACVIVKFDIFHPYFWYSVFFWLYSAGYPILYSFGYYRSYDYNKTGIVLDWVFLSVLLVILPAESLVKKDTLFVNDKRASVITDFFSYFFALYLCVDMLLICQGGYSNKTEIYKHANTFIILGFVIGYILILFFEFSLYVTLFNEEKIKAIHIISWITISGFSILTGERDYLFTILLVTVLIMFLYERISKKTLFILIPIGMILLPLSNTFKYYLLSGKEGTSFRLNHLLMEFLDGEFVSAGRNLQILIMNHCANYFKGKTLVYDIVRIFSGNTFSVQAWFNDTFFSYSHSTKYGFTIVGEGYVNWGIWGVIIWAIIVGILIRVLYVQSCKNYYYMLIYLYMLPLFIYAIRADLANIFSPLVKYAFLGTLIVYIFQRTYISRIFIDE